MASRPALEVVSELVTSPQFQSASQKFLRMAEIIQKLPPEERDKLIPPSSPASKYSIFLEEWEKSNRSYDETETFDNNEVIEKNVGEVVKAFSDDTDSDAFRTALRKIAPHILTVVLNIVASFIFLWMINFYLDPASSDSEGHVELSAIPESFRFVVVQTHLNVRISPSIPEETQAENIIDKLSRGKSVLLLERKGTWAKIRYSPDGDKTIQSTGWVSVEFLAKPELDFTKPY